MAKKPKPKTKKKKPNTKPTTKQKRAVANMVENGGNVSKAMRKAGYRKATAKNPKKLTDSKGFKQEAKTFIEKLEDERLKALNAMKLKRGKAKYRDLSDAVDKLTKVSQLLGGKPTEIIPQPILKLPKNNK